MRPLTWRIAHLNVYWTECDLLPEELLGFFLYEGERFVVNVPIIQVFGINVSERRTFKGTCRNMHL